jgi:hypothetical protein
MIKHSATASSNQDLAGRVLRAGLLTALVDGLFSTILTTAVYGSTFARLWQGVASVLLGPAAFEGGTRTIVIGLLMHVGVAFWWSAVFVFLILRSAWVRRVLASPHGVIRVAAPYGPLIWVFMSLVVIPIFAHRPPTIGLRWWVQLVGHFPFVGIPIVASSARPPRASPPSPA